MVCHTKHQGVFTKKFRPRDYIRLGFIYGRGAGKQQIAFSWGMRCVGDAIIVILCRWLCRTVENLSAPPKPN